MYSIDDTMRIELEQYSPPLGDGEALLKFSGTMPMQLHEHEPTERMY